jgi:hypothetical protein
MRQTGLEYTGIEEFSGGGVRSKLKDDTNVIESLRRKYQFTF